MKTIYLDYNATTPLDDSVREAMLPFLGAAFGNPSSVHHVGRYIRSCLDAFRETISSVWQCKPSEIIFTSGGTEANNLAILGTARLLRAKGRHLITSVIEHPSVLQSFQYLEENEGFTVTYLPVDSEARIHPSLLVDALRPDTVLVSLMAANNEVGTLQPVSDLGLICRERSIVFHTDAVQWFGKEPFTSIHQFNADLVSCCGHKIHGPKGSGALYIRSPFRPHPLLLGGSHENELRAGTENVASIAGFAKAIESFVVEPVFEPSLMAPLIQRLRDSIPSVPGCSILSPSDYCLANTLSVAVSSVDSQTLIAALDLEGICASSGSACSSGSLSQSHVLSAMLHSTLSDASLLRFSLGRSNTSDDIDTLLSVFPSIVSRSQVCS